MVVKINNVNGLMLKRGFQVAVSMLDMNKEAVNSLNVFPVPDGDTGTNMALTMHSAIKAIDGVENPTVRNIAKAASSGSLMGARGNSGVILSQLLRGLSIGLSQSDEADISDLNEAMQQAAKVAYNAVMKPTEGTILTVARMMAEFSAENYGEYEDIISYLKAVIAEGNRVLDLTPEMLPQLKEAGVVDAGGKGYLIILEGLLQGFTSDKVEFVPTVESFSVFADKAHTESENIEFGYCTEFMINRSDGNYLAFRERLSAYGDCLLVVADDDVTKVHIHTNHPGKVMEMALEIGPLSDIKVDNMRFQNEKLKAKNEEESHQINDEELDFAFISVSSGDGINKVFEELNVTKIISGGQTMNPSTEDFLNAIKEINAKDIYILPNNKNIVLAANQAAEMTDANVHVIKTTTIPQGFTALLAFDETDSPKQNCANMDEAIKDVKTLQVTYAVRDSDNNGIHIKKDDFIGLLDGKIVLSHSDLITATLNLLNKSVDDNDSLITIFYGDGVTDKLADDLVSDIEQKYPSFDIELVKGDQPVYKFIISVE
ncbi:MAG: DAK2 domain-containing protein [Tissierellia bacterium]|nr:DAK2 domain-containing protein [Tissierellia bacterium]